MDSRRHEFDSSCLIQVVAAEPDIERCALTPPARKDTGNLGGQRRLNSSAKQACRIGKQSNRRHDSTSRILEYRPRHHRKYIVKLKRFGPFAADCRRLKSLIRCIYSWSAAGWFVGASRFALMSALCCAFVIATGSLSYSQSADLAATIAELEDSVRRKPEFAEGWYDLGQTYVRRARESDGRDTPSYFRDLERALASLRQASRLRPDLPNIHNLLGWLHQEVGDIGASVKEFREAIQAEPTSASAYHNLGSALMLQHDLPGAVRAYQRAVELDPDFVSAHLSLSSALQQRGGIEQALQERQEAVERQPSSGLAHALLGHAWFLTGNSRTQTKNFAGSRSRASTRDCAFLS